ncbi:MAG: CoB--CoM heterodisulfide reductase iron-sulfur subunit B family protein [Pseudomonadota bacterium]
MSIAYYPGCSAVGTSLDYETSTQAICKVLGLHFQELSGWSCCGSTPAHATSEELSAALSSRNLDLAARLGADKVATPCPSCLSNLRMAHKRLQKPAFRERINGLMDEPLSEDLPQSYSVLQLLHADFMEAIKNNVQRPLEGIKVAPYYGCLLSRPADVMADFGNPENPMIMDDILAALGAEVIDFPLKTECCGASNGIPERPMTAKLSGNILQVAKNMGADVVAVACPLCQMNLDLRQKQAERANATKYDMPVLYYTQLMGLAFGLLTKDICLDKLVVSPDALMKKIQEQGR